jgi:tRNA modification GTPase
MQDTIAAISTPFGEGAIALLRMSGPDAVAIAQKVFRPARPGVCLAELPPRVQHLGRIMEGESVVDEVLLTIFRAPASYTGQEMVEIACHGGILVTRRLLGLLLNSGARAAGPGEFSQRAFLNGKMDLTQAEAVMDLIKAQTDLALRAATEQLEGRLGNRVREIRDGLLELLAHVEAFIDFPDEDIDPETGSALLGRLALARQQIGHLLQTADQGRVLREGVRTVIYGSPNVGKSSLLNLLLGYERAIVSDIPGTTRDTIEEVINLRGIPLRLVDTAGVRESSDVIEQQGIARTLRHLERADLVLHVVDASQPPSETINPAHLVILNKIDLGMHSDWANVPGVQISCREEGSEGMAALGDAVFDRVMGKGLAGGDFTVAINARHQACLIEADRFALAAQQALENGLSVEFASIEIRSALDAVGDIVGRLDTEDLLGKIFSTFCLGK